jgi:electron transport complex protein RnfA
MAANSAVLGSVLVITRAVSTIGQCIVAGLAAGAGYGAVLLLLAGIRRRLEIEDVPASMRGLPLELVSAGLLALAFLAFDRAFLARVAGG